MRVRMRVLDSLFLVAARIGFWRIGKNKTKKIKKIEEKERAACVTDAMPRVDRERARRAALARAARQTMYQVPCNQPVQAARVGCAPVTSIAAADQLALYSASV